MFPAWPIRVPNRYVLAIECDGAPYAGDAEKMRAQQIMVEVRAETAGAGSDDEELALRRPRGPLATVAETRGFRA